MNIRWQFISKYVFYLYTFSKDIFLFVLKNWLSVLAREYVFWSAVSTAFGINVISFDPGTICSQWVSELSWTFTQTWGCVTHWVINPSYVSPHPSAHEQIKLLLTWKQGMLVWFLYDAIAHGTCSPNTYTLLGGRKQMPLVFDVFIITLTMIDSLLYKHSL